MSEQLEPRIAAYLQHCMPEAREVQVLAVSRIFGGSSCETYRVKARWVVGSETVERGLILRRTSPAGLLETDRAVEFEAYRAAKAAGVAVPEALFVESNPAWLDRPFFVMEEVTDAQAATNLTDNNPYGEHAVKLGEQFYHQLGLLVRFDPAQAPDLLAKLPQRTPQDAWRLELDYWAGVIAEDALVPQPIAEAAIRWLRRNPPPPPQRLCLVHGDWRTGNFLYNPAGELKAVLDWEMMHLGDPLEDLAWSIDPVWGDAQGRAGKMLPTDQAIACWEAASGLQVDPQALLWWRLFSNVKGMGIWLSAGAEYAALRNTDPIMAFPAWLCVDAHNRIISMTLKMLNQARQAQGLKIEEAVL